MTQRHQTSIVLITSCVFSAVLGGLVVYKYLNKLDTKKSQLGKKVVVGKDSELLIKEQLSRNIQFFGDEGQSKIDNSFVIVVGVGGVGSHAAHLLARAGVRKLRIIDFDNVSLSSLNRHAVAVREDVGTPKVDALAKYINKFAPFCNVDARNAMFKGEDASDLLGDNPTFILDCIDDTNTKLDLLAYAVDHKIPILSSMGAGAKADPTRLHFTSLANVVRDPLATKLRSELKKRPQAASMEKVEVLYSSEDPIMKLLPLEDESVAPQELGAVPNFRVRIMPVLGTMPAIFGIAMASRALTIIAGKAFNPTTLPPLKGSGVHKLLQRLQTRLGKNYPDDETKSVQGLVDVDMECIVTRFHCKCAVTKYKLNKGGTKMDVCLWQFDRPATVDNLILCSAKGLQKVEELAAQKQVPTARQLGIPQEDFQDILECLYALRTPERKRLELKHHSDVNAAIKRGIEHMNKDHLEDCLHLVQVFGDVPNAKRVTMTYMDIFGMVFECELGDGKTCKSRVQFPSPVLLPIDIRKYAVALTLQARNLLEHEKQTQ